MPNHKVSEKLVTVKEAMKLLAKGGVDITEVWFRMLISDGKIKSEMNYNTRLVHKTDVDRLIKERAQRLSQ